MEQDQEQLEISAIPSTSKVCQICATDTSRYTCPRCTIRTCSLHCSKQHKVFTRCTGERNKAAYVPMNAYTEGKFLDDYKWLEEGRRKVEGWGKEIDERKLVSPQGQGQGSGSSGMRGNIRGRGRGRSGGRDAGWAGHPVKETKLDILVRELAAKDIHMRVLPEGMEKRRLNQSGIDTKTNTIYLSIQTVFHLPPSSIPAESPTRATHTFLLTRIPINTTLDDTFDSHPKMPPMFEPFMTKDKKGANKMDAKSINGLTKGTGENISAAEGASGLPLALPHPHSDIIFVIRSISGTPRNESYRPPFVSTRTLEEMLRGETFVEYPTLEIWTKGMWEEEVKHGRVTIVEKVKEIEESDTQETSSEEEQEEVYEQAPLSERKRDIGALDQDETEVPISKRPRADDDIQVEAVEAQKERLSQRGGGIGGLVGYASSEEEED